MQGAVVVPQYVGEDRHENDGGGGGERAMFFKNLTSKVKGIEIFWI